MNNGIEYFSLDVYLDDKFALIEAEFGLTGFAVVVKLFQKIYGQRGYYCEWNEDVALLFSRQNGVGGNVVSEIIKSALKRGIFDKNLYDKFGILTSKGIQKRYLEATKRRLKVDIKSQYLLINTAQKYKNVNILSENVYIEDENVNRLEQSKVKESRVKESKVNDDGLSSVVVCYENNVAPINQIVRDSMIDWLNDIDSDVIIWAINEAVKLNKRNWKYIEGILRNQFNKGNTTLDKITASEKERGNNTKSNSYTSNNNAYDFDGIEKQMWANLKNENTKHDDYSDLFKKFELG